MNLEIQFAVSVATLLGLRHPCGLHSDTLMCSLRRQQSEGEGACWALRWGAAAAPGPRAALQPAPGPVPAQPPTPVLRLLRVVCVLAFWE